MWYDAPSSLAPKMISCTGNTKGREDHTRLFKKGKNDTIITTDSLHQQYWNYNWVSLNAKNPHSRKITLLEFKENNPVLSFNYFVFFVFFGTFCVWKRNVVEWTNKDESNWTCTRSPCCCELIAFQCTCVCGWWSVHVAISGWAHSRILRTAGDVLSLF